MLKEYKVTIEARGLFSRGRAIIIYDAINAEEAVALANKEIEDQLRGRFLLFTHVFVIDVELVK